MSKNLRRCMKHMDIYCCTKGKSLKKSFLQQISRNDCFFDAIYEIINNIFLGKLNLSKLTPAQKKSVRRSANLMCKIHKRPKSKAKRKKLSNQTGGLIQLFYPLLAEKVASILRNALSKASYVGST